MEAKLCGRYSICRVPRTVAAENYEPEIVAIGPYHHGKDKFNQMETKKLRCLESLVDRANVSMECLRSAIEGMEKRARDCYEKPMDMDKSDFIQMLVVDGCFIIELIRGYEFCHSYYGIGWDLILLENQIPFFVLCKLFDLVQGPDQHSLLMELFSSYCTPVSPGQQVVYKVKRSIDNVKHILDLVHGYWHPFPFHHKCETYTRARKPGHIIPCTASQLKDAKVKFEKKNTTSVSDVEFMVDEGILLVPTLLIRDSTEGALRNLIVYEDSFLINDVRPVTDYAVLLSRLIHSSKDVQILRQHGIIEDDRMRCGQAVADFVNRLAGKRIIRRDDFMYEDLFDRINRYKEKRRIRNRVATILQVLGRIISCAH